ncbi:DSK2A [Symbiodinium natans]|uniref:DSK2A protein n=1 Tax=Symbiodinium natans TaxID=878477 RepID=A0A812SLR9_9DINO|nr:DSK2A [Symbiodinium natans]
MQSLLNDHDFMRSLLKMDPRLSKLLENCPELNLMLHDPEVMKQATEALRNPVHVRDVIRSTDRSMSQLEGLGTGSFDVLRQMCEDIRRPMQDEEYVRLLAAAEAQKKEAEKAEKLKSQRKMQGQADLEEDDDVPGEEKAEEDGAQEAPEEALAPEEEEEEGVEAPTWVGTFDTNAMAAMMQDQNMQSLLAQLVQAMPGPGIKVHPDDPFLDPSFIGQMFHAQTIDSMVKLQDAVEKLSMTDGAKASAPNARKKKGQDIKDDGPAYDSPAALSGLHYRSPAHNFKECFNMFIAAEQESPEIRYKGQLQAMRNMGFTDQEACIQALHNCDGNMNKAVELLMEKAEPNHRCKGQKCERCGRRVSLLGVDGFGIVRRRHERRCSIESAAQQQAIQPPVDEPSGAGASSSSTATGEAEALVPSAPALGESAPTREETRWRFYPFSRLRSVLRCGRRSRPQPKGASSALADGAMSVSQPSESAHPSSMVRPKASSLLSTFQVSAALERAAAGELQGFTPLETVWLQSVADKAPVARQSVQVPPEGEGWHGPLDSNDGRWSLQLWYKWSSATVISTVCRVALPGSFCEVLSLFREADLAANWLPFVSGGNCSFSQDLPALLTSVRIKLPLVPYSLRTLIHRAFIDEFRSTSSPGVCIVEWTPPDIEPTGYCGMAVPAIPPRSSAMQVQLGATKISSEPDEQNRCVVVTATQNDFKVNNRLVPNMALRKFLAINSRVVAGNMAACLEDMERFGYSQRIEKDAQVLDLQLSPLHWQQVSHIFAAPVVPVKLRTWIMKDIVRQPAARQTPDKLRKVEAVLATNGYRSVPSDCKGNSRNGCGGRPDGAKGHANPSALWTMSSWILQAMQDLHTAHMMEEKAGSSSDSTPDWRGDEEVVPTAGMAGDDALTASGFSADEREAATDAPGKTHRSAKVVEDELYDAVMARLEVVLSEQESALWQHGQEEIAQMQRDHESHENVWASLQELASHQAELRDQQAEMNREILQISKKLDFVKELNEAAGIDGEQHLPKCEVHAPSASVACPATSSAEVLQSHYDDILVDSAGHQLLPPLLLSSVGSPAAGPDTATIMSAVCAAAQAAASAAAAAVAGLPMAGGFPVGSNDNAEGPRTPRKHRPGPTVLSLASALTSEQTPPPAPRKRAPSRLNIAAHLEEAKPTPPAALRAEAPAFVPGAEVLRAN